MRTRSGGEGAEHARQRRGKEAIPEQSVQREEREGEATESESAWKREMGKDGNGEFSPNGNHFDCGKRGKLRVHS